MEKRSIKSPTDRLMVLVALTLAVTVMNATMFNIVLPEIRHEFKLSMSEVSWVSTTYLLVFAVGSVVYGKLADACRLKSLITFGFITFAAGSLVGMLSVSYGMVIAGRMLQAAGAAVIPAVSGIIPVRYVPSSTRGRALGITMTGGAVGSAAGPALAALLSSVVHWRLLFLLPVLTLLLLPLYYKYLQDDRQGRKVRMDWLGGGLLAGTIAMLLLFVTSVAPWTFIGFVLLMAALLLRITRAEEPFISPRLFSNRRYALGLGIVFMTTGIGYSLAFLTPTLLSELHGMGDGRAGWVLVPAAVLAAFLSKTGGRTADRKGNSFLFFLASTLYMICFLMMSSFSMGAQIFIALFLIFGTVGQAFMSISLTKTISLALPKDQSGVGLGLMSMLNFVSGAVFASLYGRMVDQGIGSAWNPLMGEKGDEADTFSNIYLLLAVLMMAVVMIYAAGFMRRSKKLQDASSTG